MKAVTQACPHCGSHNHRVLADLRGSIVWCQDCHRAWEQARPAAPTTATTPERPNKLDLRTC